MERVLRMGARIESARAVAFRNCLAGGLLRSGVGRLVLLLVLMLGFGVDSALASGQVVGTAAKKPTENEIYEGCGQSCLYQRANENLALQALYLTNHIISLNDRDASERKSALGSFCIASEDGDACFNRYKRMNIVALYKMRDAMIQNSNNASALMNRRVFVGDEKKPLQGNPPAAEFQISGLGPKKAQVPYVVTFEDIKKELGSLRALTGREYQEWASNLKAAPSREEFVKFRRIYRDPDHPERGTMMVVSRDANGRIEYDEKAFKTAEAYYLKHKSDMDADLAAIKGRGLQPVDRLPDQERVAEADFKESRKLIVDAANGGLVKGRIPSQNKMDFKGGTKALSEAELVKLKIEKAKGRRQRTLDEKEPQVIVPPTAEDGSSQFLTVTLKPEQLMDMINTLQKLED